MSLQWLVTKHGLEILDTIRRHATKLNLPLDYLETVSQPSIVHRPRVEGQALAGRGDLSLVSPAKEEAWKLWQEQGLSFCAIAVRPTDSVGLLVHLYISFSISEFLFTLLQPKD